MDPPSPKRRKPSPTKTGPEAPVTETGDFIPRNQLRRTPPRRASFQSPTKASLSRFNPEILSRRTSTGSEKKSNPSDPTGRGQRALAYVLGKTEQLNPGEATSNDQAQGGATETAETTDAADTEVEAEDLPAHPEDSQPDLPPHEGLFSSPRKSPAKRNKSLGQYLSSPSKQAALPGSQIQRISRAPLEAKGPSPIAVEDDENRILVAASGKEQTLKPERPSEPDPKQQEKEELQAKLKSLREEVEFIESQVQLSRNAPSDGEDASALVSFINEQEPCVAPARAEPPPLAAMLASFLPLAKRMHPPSPPTDEPERPMPTHEPIDLEDPYPYLSLFTDFQFTSSVSMSDLDQQIHAVTMRSPSSLLKLNLNLAVDITTKHVQRLEILRLSNWASRELGTYIAKASEENDLGAVCSATTSYWDLAVRRATCWARCHREFPHLLPHYQTKERQGDVSRSSNRKTSGNHETPASMNAQDEEEEEVSGIVMDAAVKEQNELSFTKGDLLPLLDHNHILLQSNQVLFKITWKIQFDWSGEAQSVVNAEAVFPKAWTEADNRGSFKKIPETFERLLATRGAFGAITILKSVLFS
ncbi:hypothetical protein IWZ01DRAFT_269387 [Phyllosticta capitalensis]